MIYLQKFKVQGSGDFPVDMLRYDRCWPTSEGVTEIGLSRFDDHRVRTVELCRIVFDKKAFPTIDRWRSFAWEVVGDVRTEKV